MVPVRRSVKTLAAAAADGKPRYEPVYLPVELICAPLLVNERLCRTAWHTGCRSLLRSGAAARRGGRAALMLASDRRRFPAATPRQGTRYRDTGTVAAPVLLVSFARGLVRGGHYRADYYVPARAATTAAVPDMSDHVAQAGELGSTCLREIAAENHRPPDGDSVRLGAA